MVIVDKAISVVMMYLSVMMFYVVFYMIMTMCATLLWKILVSTDMPVLVGFSVGMAFSEVLQIVLN